MIHLSGKGYETLGTLEEAVALARAQIVRDEKPEYAALLSTSRVREAIRAAVRSEARQLAQEEQRHPGSRDYWRKHVAPIYRRIARDGVWFESCSFSGFYAIIERRSGRRVATECFGLRLSIATPGAAFEGFALPIVDVRFGGGMDSTSEAD